MNSFRTELVLEPAARPIELNNLILTIGSCFSDDIGKLLHDSKFKTDVNSLGTLYNPLSIHKALSYAIELNQPEESLYTQHAQIWNHFDFHSQWGDPKREIVQSNLNREIERLHQVVKKANVVIITYGTAWAYELKQAKNIVANCHKVPQHEFNKVLLSVDQICESFSVLYQKLKSFNSAIGIITTISPVRHTRDSLELNNVSKSILRVAVHQLCNQHPEIEYFPSYEIMMDDLRDYRFYKSDFIHPNDTAIEYIWNKFSNRYFNSATKSVISRWSSLKKTLEHKSFHHTSEAHQNFLKATLVKLTELNSNLDLTEEIKSIQTQIT